MCNHSEIRIHKWVTVDGALMISQKCLKCATVLDEGVVYGEDDGNWSGVEIILVPQPPQPPQPSLFDRFLAWFR